MKKQIRHYTLLALVTLLSLLLPISLPRSLAGPILVQDPESDTVPPAPVIDLIASTSVTPGSVDLGWTAPGDDSLDGTAAVYTIRYYSEPIDDANWAMTSDVTGEPTPGPAGTEEHMSVSGLTPGLSYYFALVTEDEARNPSGLSNTARAAAQFSPDTTFLPVAVSGAESTPTVIAETTKVLPPQTTQYLESISEDGTTFSFSQSTPALTGLKPGDIIVGDVSDNAPYGFLRQVTSVSFDDEQVIVITEQGTLEEAFESTEVEVSQELSPDQIRSGTQLRGVTLIESADREFTVALKHVVLYDLDNDENTTNDQCTADGRVTIEPDFKFNLKIKRFRLKDLSFITTAKEKADLTVGCNLAKHITKEKQVAKWNLGTYTVMAGYVPLVFTPQLSIFVGLDGSVHVGISTGVVQDSSMTLGARYDGSHWSPVCDFTNHFGYTPPTLSAGLDVKGYTAARISILLYGTTGNYNQIDNYLKLVANLNTTPWWKLYGGLTVRFGIELKAFSKRLADYDIVLIDRRWPLLEAPNRPPNQPNTPSPANHASNIAVSAGLSWKGGDPDWGDVVTYDAYFEAGDTTPDVLLCDNATKTTCQPPAMAPNTQYYWQVVATDRRGATTTGPVWDFTTAAPPNKPPNQPANPSPANLATNVSITSKLGWSGGDPDGDAVAYDIYFEAGDNTPDVLLCDNATATGCDPGALAYSTKYYWQVVASDQRGAITAGPVWDFTTAAPPNKPPNQPASPSPANHATNVSISAELAWSGGDPDGDPVTYAVYFEAGDNTPDILLCNNTSATTCRPATMAPNLKFYWQVVATDNRGATTSGPVWDFTTATQLLSSTSRVSISSNGTQSNRISFDSAISANGRFVSFSTEAFNLVAGDTNGTSDVFVHDRLTGQTSRVSVSSDGIQGNFDSGNTDRPALSADGRFVAFGSYASNLTPGDTNETEDIFVHDRQTGQTSRISVASDGTQSNGRSGCPAISNDGRFVAFSSKATTLISGDTNSWWDVFVHDRQSGQISRVSVASNGAQGNRSSGFAQVAISGDGRFVAFDSGATNLVPGDTNSVSDIFIHDRQTGQTTRVSVASDGTQGNKASYQGLTISADGRFVSFASEASNLVLDDTNDAYDIFVHDRQTGQTSRVSVATDGSQGNGWSIHTAISADGRFVAFTSNASNLVLDDTNNTYDIFVRDRLTGQTSRVSVASDGTQGNGWSQQTTISADGRFVAFKSEASNLVLDDTNGVSDVFVHDRGQ